MTQREATLSTTRHGPETAAASPGDPVVQRQRAAVAKIYELLGVDLKSKDAPIHRALLDLVSLDLKLSEPATKWSEIPLDRLEDFIARRNAVVDEPTASIAAGKEAAPAGSAIKARIAAFLAHHGIKDDSDEMQTLTATIAAETDGFVQYDWRSLNEAEMTSLLLELEQSREDVAEEAVL